MNQTDFSPAAGGAAASVAAASKVAANEPISPFDHSRRFVPPTSNANYEGGEYDYNNYPPQQDYTYQDQQYGYYDANGYPQQQQYGYEGGYDSNRHEVQNDNYSYYTGPSASRTSGSDWNQGVVSDKPNLKDQKPNQA
jgi:hypothetical protein